MPRQLTLLERSIDGERDPVRAACMRAEHVSLLARHGYHAQAAAALIALRTRYDGQPHPVVTPWINLADAIVSSTTHGTPSAILKLRRAHALASAAANTPIRGLVAAWLAHFLWNADEVEPAVGYAREALRLAPLHDHKTRVRACLVVADMWASADRAGLAAQWFAKARAHASAVGDDASKSALNFNLSAIQCMLLRQASLASAPRADARVAELHRAVSENIDAALGVATDELSLFDRAQMLSLVGRPHEALAIYERHSRTAANAYAIREQPVRLAHEAWCLSRVDRPAEAREVARMTEAAIDATTHVDDVACCHSLLVKVWHAAGEAAQASHHTRVANAAWQRFAEFQGEIARLAESITESG